MIVITSIGHKTTFADLYNNPTVKSLAAAISQKEDLPTSTSMLVKMTGKSSSAAANIICFPYGGGNGVVFMDLADALNRLGKDFNLFTIDLPGRDLVCETELLPIDEIAQTSCSGD